MLFAGRFLQLDLRFHANVMIQRQLDSTSSDLSRELWTVNVNVSVVVQSVLAEHFVFRFV